MSPFKLLGQDEDHSPSIRGYVNGNIQNGKAEYEALQACTRAAV